MNSSKLPATATASANSAAAVDGLSFLAPTGSSSVDVIAEEATTEFQSLIQELLPDVVEHGLLVADSGDAGSATDARAPSANQDLSTAQLLLQLPLMMPATQPSNNATQQGLSGIDTGTALIEGATFMAVQTAGVFATLQAESVDVNNEPLPGREPERVYAAANRLGEDGTSAWLTEGVLPAALLKLQEPGDRSTSPQGHQGEKGPRMLPPQSLPPVAAAIAAAASAGEVASLPRMENPVSTAAWRQELANTVNLMIDRGEQSATLRLSPEHLGPLEVRIAIREGETSLWFGAAHVDTRHALEQALPRLREQFANAGLSLGQSSVSQGSPQEPRNLRAAMISGLSAARSDSGESSKPPSAVTSRITGLIDTYV